VVVEDRVPGPALLLLWRGNVGRDVRDLADVGVEIGEVAQPDGGAGQQFRGEPFLAGSDRLGAAVLDQAAEQADDAVGAAEQVFRHRAGGEHAAGGAQEPELVLDPGQVLQERGDPCGRGVVERVEVDQVEPTAGLGSGRVAVAAAGEGPLASPSRVPGASFTALFCSRPRIRSETFPLIGVSCSRRFTWVAVRCRSCSARPRGLRAWYPASDSLGAGMKDPRVVRHCCQPSHRVRSGGGPARRNGTTGLSPAAGWSVTLAGPPRRPRAARTRCGPGSLLPGGEAASG
jgi:hypothetical protein